MEPGKTSFFQALGVPTKIARGTIEITTDLKLVETGAKVGPSEATLLNMLNISPFTYGMTISQVYDQGNTFSSDVLDIGEEQLLKTFTSAITTISCLSLALNYPTLPSVIHSVVNTYKKVLAVAIETDFSWPEIEELKDRIANPEAYASAAPVAAAADDKPADTKPADDDEKSGDDSDDDDGGFGGLLLVFPSSIFSTQRLTLTLATNGIDNGITPVFEVRQSCLEGQEKVVMDLYPRIHRSFAGHTNFNPRLSWTAFYIHS
jgi:large subunit ribosomal protein LP0